MVNGKGFNSLGDAFREAEIKKGGGNPLVDDAARITPDNSPDAGLAKRSLGAAAGGFEFPREFFDERTNGGKNKRMVRTLEKYQDIISKEIEEKEKNGVSVDKKQIALDYFHGLPKKKIPKALFEGFKSYLKKEEELDVPPQAPDVPPTTPDDLPKPPGENESKEKLEEFLKKGVFSRVRFEIKEQKVKIRAKEHKEIVLIMAKEILQKISEYAQINIWPKLGKEDQGKLKAELDEQVRKEANLAVAEFATGFKKEQEGRYKGGDLYKNKEGEHIKILSYEDGLYEIDVKFKDKKGELQFSENELEEKIKLKGLTLAEKIESGSATRIAQNLEHLEAKSKDRIENMAKGALLMDTEFNQFKIDLPRFAQRFDGKEKQEAEAYLTKVNQRLEDFYKTKKYEFSRAGSEITLGRLEDPENDLKYTDLDGANQEEREKKFLRKTLELWNEFAVHGGINKNEKTGEITVNPNADLDGSCSLKLLEMAGFHINFDKKTGNVTYVLPGGIEEGKINLDTSNQEGVVVRGKTAAIDHHAEDSSKDTSTTRYVYRMLVDMGLLKKEKSTDRLVDFVTRMDNGDYPGIDKYFKNSWKTLVGLARYAKPANLVKFFEKNKSPNDLVRELSPDDLRRYGFIYTKNGEIKKNYSAGQEDIAKKSERNLKRMEKEGLIIDSKRYGRIAVDIIFGGKKAVTGDFLAARAYGCDTYLIWNPAENRFKISTRTPIAENYPQGRKLRQTMWIKPLTDDSKLTFTLEEMLTKMTDGEFKPEGKLKAYIEKERKRTERLEQEKADELEEIEGWGKEFWETLRDDEAAWTDKKYGQAEKEKILKKETGITLESLFSKSEFFESQSKELSEKTLQKIINEV